MKDKAYIGDEIVEGNKLISKFMDMEQHEDYDYLYCRKLGSIYSRLQYHSSWDWLMPVVEKINNIFGNWSETTRFKEMNPIYRKIQNELLFANIVGTHEWCVIFITWFNTQNKQS